ncbi:MAG: CDP-alcohol phosphatidyltransferase family protein [Acidimicrobiia bacterium]|nr:CDP-alcohol phosphatidyltransferase family protein [Acidimicrobiia bacterium]MYC58537.1 CDP-alcohol phosphatidyltransferase family protein [Acidimicrobiia bacterium]MYI30356.1 CDP-alcohol phosphatidyltransferase family protein [Acidimicrobiia bacterium]
MSSNQWRVEITSNLATIPNLISGLRLGCVPFFCVLLLAMGNRVVAAILLGVLGATDWVDGFIARRFKQESEMGKILDPTADRLMFLAAVTAMLIDGSLHLVFGVLMLMREAAVSLVVLILAALGAMRMDVTWTGKTATFGLMFALPLLLLGNSNVGGGVALRSVGWGIAILSLALSYYAAIQYIPQARQALTEGRANQASSQTSSS